MRCAGIADFGVSGLLLVLEAALDLSGVTVFSEFCAAATFSKQVRARIEVKSFIGKDLRVASFPPPLY